MMTNRNIRLCFGAMILFAASCAQIVGMEEGVLKKEGPTVECNVFEDCLKEATECRVPESCNEGTCKFKNTIRDKPITAQTAGDCKKVVCDGAGLTEELVDDTDVNDDNNGCTADSCNGGDAVHKPIPGQMLPCYTGPEGTEDVGICKGGMQACDAQGQPNGPCEGEVLPQAEVCDTSPIDENCNGMTNETGTEGGTCSCGDNVISTVIGEICDDGNVVGGDGCSPICSPIQAVQVAVGNNHTCVRFDNNTVKCWGDNPQGQLGIGSTTDIGAMAAQMGANLAAVPMPAGIKIMRIECGFSSCCALMDDNKLRCWGGNDAGQLGEGNQNNRGDAPGEMVDAIPYVDLGSSEAIVDFSVGSRHACAVLADGIVKCWGANGGGQLGLGDTLARGYGPNQMGTNLAPVNLGLTAKKIALGDNHSCAILSDDSVKCWGTNAYGELGLGDLTPRGKMMSDMGSALLPVDLGTGRTAKAISGGNAHTCAILDDDSVKCWGLNSGGQLGLGDANSRGDGPDEMGDMLLPVKLGTAGKPVMIAAGVNSTCVLFDGQTVKCWGGNTFGQLGTGDQLARGNDPDEMDDKLLPIDLGKGRLALSIQVGNGFTCVLLDDTSVKCWGLNGPEGRLGLGDTANRGGAAGQMGDDLPIVKLFSDTW